MPDKYGKKVYLKFRVKICIEAAQLTRRFQSFPDIDKKIYIFQKGKLHSRFCFFDVGETSLFSNYLGLIMADIDHR